MFSSILVFAMEIGLVNCEISLASTTELLLNYFFFPIIWELCTRDLVLSYCTFDFSHRHQFNSQALLKIEKTPFSRNRLFRVDRVLLTLLENPLLY